MPIIIYFLTVLFCIQGPPGYTQPDEPMSKSALELLKDTTPAEASHSLLSTKPTTKSEVKHTEELMSERQLQSASMYVKGHKLHGCVYTTIVLHSTERKQGNKRIYY